VIRRRPSRTTNYRFAAVASFVYSIILWPVVLLSGTIRNVEFLNN